VKSRGSQCNETLLLRAAVRPGKKLGLQPAAMPVLICMCLCRFAKQTVLFAVACSPAQASAAPAVMQDQSVMLAAQYGRYAGQNTVSHECQSMSQLSRSPRVICEQLTPDAQVVDCCFFVCQFLGGIAYVS